MTSTRLTVSQALRRAVARATLAPSIHNSQPWRFVLRGTVLELRADRVRQLLVLDPAGRQLAISCGCALFNVRVALAAAGYGCRVDRLPDPTRPTLLARISAGEPDSPCRTDELLLEQELDFGAIAQLDPAIELRHTNRRRFLDEPVPEELIDRLALLAFAEHAQLTAITDAGQRLATEALSERADALENADPAYRAELRAWAPGSAPRPAGVALAQRGGTSHAIPGREAETSVLPSASGAGVDQCLLLLWTAADTPLDWLQAGEALQRALLELTRQGYVAGILSQVAEVPAVRTLLARELRVPGSPHLLVRVGRAPATPAVRRRRLVEVLVEHL